MKISTQGALVKPKEKHQPLFKLFEYGNLEVEIYTPAKVDRQKPHNIDEVYIVISGRGDVHNNGDTQPFIAGDFLFIPAGKEHRFLNFTDDFATWDFSFDQMDDRRKLLIKMK